MILTLLVRRLKPGVTFEEFRATWLADPGHFGTAIDVSHAQRLDDDREITSYALIDATREQILAALANADLRRGEQVRHDRIEDLLESTVLTGLYEVLDTTRLT